MSIRYLIVVAAAAIGLVWFGAYLDKGGNLVLANAAIQPETDPLAGYEKYLSIWVGGITYENNNILVESGTGEHEHTSENGHRTTSSFENNMRANETTGSLAQGRYDTPLAESGNGSTDFEGPRYSVEEGVGHSAEGDIHIHE